MASWTQSEESGTSNGSWTAKIVAGLVVFIVVGFVVGIARADEGPLGSSTGAAATCALTGAEQLSADYASGTLTVRGSGFSSLCDVTVQTTGPINAVDTGGASSDLLGAFTYTTSVAGSTGLYRVDALGFGGSTLASTNFSLTVGGPTSSLIVKLASGLSSSEQDAVIARDGGSETTAIPALRLHVVDVSTSDVDATLANYQNDEQVSRVELDLTREAGAGPSDPGYASQWALQQIGWDKVFGSVDANGSATLAVLDTGVSSAGGDLNVGNGWSAFGNDPTSDPNGHGTWVASIAAASADNGKGIAGVDYAASTTVEPVQVLDSNGLGQDSDIVAGVVWAADHGADVILMSFSNPGFSPALQDAIDYAWSQGAVIVAATGNEGSASPTFPAGDAKVIGVAATDSSDALWSGSNYGEDTFIAAPGVGITADAVDGSTTSISGTSAAAALVAGAAVLLKAADATATNGVIAGRLARNADAAGTAEQTGNGRLNLERSMLDTSSDSLEPAGAAPVGGGGPYVGPYVIATAAINSATVDGGASTTVAAGGTISASLSISSSNGNANQRAASIGWRIDTTPPGSVTCVDIADVSNQSNQVRTFSITAPATSGTYNAYFQAFSDNVCGTSNGSASAVFTLSNAVLVGAAPVITSANSATFGVNVPGSFTVTATGTPAPTFSETGTLPSGVTFNTSTHVLGGTPTTSGSYLIQFTATNSQGSVNQNFTLTVKNPTTVTIDQAVAQPESINTSPIHFTAVFSAPVTGFTGSGVTITGTAGGTKTATVTGSGDTYDVAISGMTTSGTVIAAVNLNAAQDADGTGNAGSTSADNTVSWDVTAPTVTVNQAAGQVDPTGASPINFTATFSEPINTGSFTSGDVTLGGTAGGTKSVAISNPSLDNRTFNLAVTGMTTNGTVTASIPAGGVSDPAGNTNAVSTTSDNSVTWDGTAPSVLTINRQSPSAQTTNATTVTFRVTFSENVAGVDANDFSLTTSGTAVGTVVSPITTVTASTYDVAVNLISGDGTLRLDLNGSSTGITDTAGNAVSGGFTTGQTYILDHTAPALGSVTGPANGSYRATQTLDFTVNYDENVTVTGTPRIALMIGATTRQANYFSGTGSSALVFRYTIVGGDNDSDGIASTSPIDLNAGTIRDAAGNNAGLAFSPPTTTGVLVDTVAPTVTVNQAAGQVDPTGASPINFTATFSEPINTGSFTSGDVTLGGTAGGTKSVAISNPSLDNRTFNLAVTGMTTNGTVTASIPAGGVSDPAGNTNAVSTTSDNSVTWDGTAPSVLTINRQSPSAQTTNATTVTFRVTFSENVAGVDANDFSLTTSGTAVGTIVSPITTVTASTYDVAVNLISGDGTLRLDLNGSSTGITDTAGNAVSGGFTTGQTYILDHTAPGAPVFTGIRDDTGSASTDQITTDQTLFLDGTGEAGATATVTRLGTGVIGTATVDGSGNWSFNYTGTTLAAGTYTFTATQADAAGNASPMSSNFVVVIDRTAPTVTIDSASPNPTTDGTTIIWHGNENGAYSVRVGGTDCATGTVVESGTYSSQPGTVSTSISAGSLPAGSTTVRVCVTDAAGNTGNTTVTMIKDTTAPITASVTTPANGSASTGPASFSGSVADNSGGSGLNTNSTTFTLQRASDANYWNGSAWQAGAFSLATTHVATTSNTATTWTSAGGTLPTWATQSEGNYTVQAMATDKAGNTFTGSAVTFTLDLANPTSAITFPSNGVTYTGAGYDAGCNDTSSNMCGTAGDGAGSGVQSVMVSIFSSAAAKYWNCNTANPNFNGNNEGNGCAAGGTTAWTLATFALTNSAISQSSSTTFTVHAWAIDNVGNVEPGQTITFTYNPTLSDTTAPTVSSINRADASPTNAGTVHWTVVFSEAVSNVDAADFALAASGPTGAAITSVTASSATTYTVTASTGTGDGSLGLNLDDNDSITDHAGNKLGGTGTGTASSGGAGNGSFTGQAYTIDKTAPTAQSINRAGTSPTKASSVDFTVTFSEAVTGVSTGNFSLTTTGTISGASVTSVTGSGSTRTVSVNTGSGNGTVRLDLSSTTGISDSAGNGLASTRDGDQSYTVDKTKPTSSILCNNAVCASTYYNADVTVKLTGSDAGGSGLKEIRYTTDGSTPDASTGTAIASGGTFTVSTTTTVKFVAVDNAGNVESPLNSETISVDKLKPTSSILCNNAACAGTYNADVTVKLTGADTGGSGLKEIRYTTDGSTPDASTGTAIASGGTFTVSNTTTVKFVAIDNAGNVESPVNSQTIEIQHNQAPTATTPSFSPASPNTNDNLTASTTVTDADGDGTTVAFVWKVTRGANTCVVRTHASASAPSGAVHADSLDLSQSYATSSCTGATPPASINPSKGDTVTVEVTPNDGTVGGTTQSNGVSIQTLAPTASSQSVTTAEDTLSTITLSGSDEDGDNLTFSIVSGPSHGTLGAIAAPFCTGFVPRSCTADVTYTPAANYNGPDSFTFKVSDGTADSSPATVSLTVNAVNDAPLCGDQSFSTDEDTLLADSVGCSDVDSASVTYSVVDDVQHGSLSLNADGSFSYTPSANYNGSDSFTFRANDGSLDSNLATATITVNEVNDVPTANADAKTLAEDGSATIDAAGNDSTGPANESGQSLSVTLVGTPDHGTASIIASGDDAGKILYTPAANYNGPDSFGYTVTDDGTTDGADDPLSDTGTVSITVTEVNDAPTANADAKTLAEDASATIDAAGNDSTGPVNESGQTLSITAVGAPDHGTTSIVDSGPSAGQILYTPDANYNGPDSFTYTVSDDGTTNGLDDPLSDTGTVSITVSEVNDAPTANADAKTLAEDGSATIDAAGNDSTGPANESGQTLSVTSVGTPDHGSAVILDSGPNAGEILYTPAANYNGPDSFSYTVTDNGATAGADDPLADTGTVSITVSEVNDAPTAQADAKTLAEDGSATINAAGNDSTGPANESAQTLSVTAVGTPDHGTASIIASGDDAGKILYTPAANYNGPDSFSYTVSDDGTTNGLADPKSDIGTVSITVSEVNDAPTANADAKTLAEDGSATIDAAGNDSAGPANESGQTLSVTSVGPPDHGTAEIIDSGPDAGQILYTPDANYNGPDSFTYTVTDSGTTDGAPDHKSGTGTVSITVTEVNDAPSAVADAKTLAEDGSATIDAAGNDSTGPANESGQSLSVTAVGTPDHGTASIIASGDDAGKILYTPAANYNGLDSFSYTVSDNGTTDGAPDHKSDTATVSITVTEVNDAPSAVADAKTLAEDGSATIDAAGNDSTGPDNESAQTLSVTSVGTPDHGTAVIVDSGPDAGQILYTPDANYNGPDSFTYTVTDSGTTNAVADHKSDTATVAITVSEVNDAPTAVADAKTLAEDGSATIDAAGNDSKGPANESGQTLTLTSVGTPDHGTAVIVDSGPNAGQIVYTPDANYNGPDSFSYTVSDDGTTNATADHKSDTATVSITVTEVNDAPTASADAKTLAEDGSATIDAAANDSKGPANESGQSLSLTAVGAPDHGTAVILNSGPDTGKLLYTPDANYNGPDSFTYTVSDDGTTNGLADPLTDTATVSITVSEVNDAPTANADAKTLAEDGSATIDAAANDSRGPANESGQTLSITSVGTPDHGTAVIVDSGPNAGEILYTPDANYNGLDSFSYTVSDNGTTNGAPDHKSDTGTVSITVTEVNDAPTANADAKSLAEDASATIDAAGNDSKGPANESGQTLSVTEVGAPDHGSAEILDSGPDAGQILYTPDANYNGPDSFSYTVTDDGTTNAVADPKSDTGTVSITVTEVNDAPTANADAKTLAEDGSATIDAAGNDSAGPANESGQTLSVTAVGTPAHGSAVILDSGPNAGEILYAPDANYNGPDSFTYTVSDDGTTDGLADPLSDTATVSITVSEVNDAPTANADAKTLAEDGSATIDAAGNDSRGPANESGQTLSVTSVGTPDHGSAVILDSGPNAGKILYAPDANYNGPDSFSYTVSDDGTTNGLADPLSDTATVSITVSEANDAPTANADAKTLAEDGSATIDAAGNDSAGTANESGQTLSVTSVGTPDHGTAEIISSGADTGKLLYTPDANYNGPDSFSYTVTDNGTTDGLDDPLSDTSTVSITVSEVNDGPTANADAKTLAEDGSSTIDAAANDSKGPANESGQTLSITSVGTPDHGSAVILDSGPNAGEILYTSDANYNGTDSFTYTVTDDGTTNAVADHKSDTATVSITVTEVNDAPTAVADAKTLAEDGSATIDAAANDSKGPANESAQTLSVTSVGTPDHGTAVIVDSGPDAGQILYTPDANYNGLDSFSYMVSDDGTTNGAPDHKSDTGTVSITVTEVNDAPTAVADAKTLAEDGSATIDAPGNDSTGPANESAQTLSVTSVGTPDHGTAVIVDSGPNAGEILYTPDANYNGLDSFGYTVSDDGTTNGAPDHKSDTGTVSITVSEVNDAPTANADAKSLAEDGSATIDAAGNDSKGPANESAQTLSITAVGTPVHGSAVILDSGPNAGEILYTPDANYNGPDSFTYTVSDDGTTDGEDDPLSDTATVSITVSEVNDAPTANADAKTLAEDGSATINAAGNDNKGPANESAQTLSVTAVGTPAHGSAVILDSGPNAGEILYAPDANYNGPDSFTYTVSDDGTTDGADDPLSDTGTVSITVTEVNDAPTANADAKTLAEDGSATIDAAGNDSNGPANESAQTLSVTSVGTPGHGSAVILDSGPDAGQILYTPDANYNGPDSFTYTVTDDGTTNAVADPKNDTGTVSITVTEVNDAPTANADAKTLAEDGSATIDAAGNDSKGPANESAQTLNVTAVGSPAHGTAVIVDSGPNAGEILYTPAANYNGPDSFTYTVSDDGTTNGLADPKSDAGTVSVTVTEVNDAPTANADAKTLAEDGSSTIDAAANDSKGPVNESGQTLSITGVGAPDHGTAEIISSGPDAGQLLYTPDANYNGPDSFGYTITDNGATVGADDPLNDTGMVSITVTEVNDAPTANADAKTLAEDGSATINAAGNDSKGPVNESGQTLSVTSVGAPDHGTAVILNSGPNAGQIHYTSDANYNGPDSFTYTVTDDGTTDGAPDHKSDTGTVSITVSEVNDAPTAVADAKTLAEDGAATVDAAANDTTGPANESAQTLNITSVGAPDHGTAEIISSGPDTGKLLYTPDANYNGPDSFTYVVSDDGTTNGLADSKSDVGTVSLTVTEVNDGPTANADAKTLAEDGSATIDAAGNDSKGPANESAQTLNVTEVGTPDHGTASIIDSGPDAGQILYTPDANYNGPDSFTYTVSDDGTTNGLADSKSDVGTVSLTVTEVNDAPTAVADAKTLAEDGLATIDTAGNDSMGPANESAQTLSVTAVGTPDHGTASIIASGDDAGQILYTPNANYNGLDSFSYTVSDDGTTNGAPDHKSDTGTVSITVTEVNDTPTANADAKTLAEDGAATIDAAGNDSTGPANESGQTLSVTSVGTPDHGSASIIASGADAGKILYTPAANYNGPDSFTYTVTDDGTTNAVADPKSDTGTVSITVSEVNDAPTANADAKTLAEDGSATIDAAGNDSTGPANESAQTPSATSVGTPDHGTASIVDSGPNAGEILYTPAANYNGPDSFGYTVSDDGTTNGAPDHKSDTGTVSITVSEVNDAPTAVADAKTLAEDGSATIDAAGNDSKGPANESGQTLSVTSVGTPDHGSAVILDSGPNAGEILYTPDANYNGPDSFNYTVSDDGTTNGLADHRSDTGTVSITVDPVNDQPTADASPNSLSLNEGASATSALSGTDVETGSADLTFTITHAPTHGTLKQGTTTLSDGSTFTGSPTDVTYHATSNYHGADEFKFTLTDTGDPAGCSAAPCDDPLSSDEVTVPITIHDVAAPPISLDQPADGSATNDATPTFSGTAGTHFGDSATVTINLYSGGTTSGTLLHTLTTSRDGAGVYSVDLGGADALANGTYTAQAEQSDDSTNTGYSSANTFVIDITRPNSQITFPVDGDSYNATAFQDGCNPSVDDICGTAGDSGAPASGLAKVEISVKQHSSGKYWDGTGFTESSETWVTVTGTTSWHYALDRPDEGQYTIHSRATDHAGNVETSFDTATFNEVGLTIDTIAPDQPTLASTTPASGANDNDPYVNGSAEAGSTVRLYTNADCTSAVAGSGPASGGSFSIAVHVADNSSTTFYATATDAAGNTSDCSDSITYVEDSATTVAITARTNPVNAANQTSASLSGTGEAGDSISIDVSDGTTHVLASATASGSGHWSKSGLDLHTLADGPISYAATATDAAGNTADDSASAAKDTATSVAITFRTDPVNAANQTSASLMGTSEANDTIAIDVSDGTTHVLGSATADATGHWSKTGLDLHTLADGPISYSVTATDAAGNTAHDSASAAKDTVTNVSITFRTDPVNAANQTSASLSGTSEADDTIAIDVSDGTTHVLDSTTADATGHWSKSGLDLHTLADGPISYTATATDAAGNTAGDSKAAAKDALTPGKPTGLGTTRASPANDNDPHVTGSAEAGTTVRIYTNSDCSSLVAGSGTATGGSAFSSGVHVTDNSTTTFYATATDEAGNTSACSTDSATYVEDSTAPTITAVSDTPDPTSTNSTLSYSLSENAKVTIKIYNASSTLVRTLVNDDSRASGANSELWDLKDGSSSYVPDGTYTYKIDAHDAAANNAAQKSGTVTVDRTGPAISNVSDTPDPTSTNSTISYSLNENASVTIKIYDASSSLVRTLVSGAARSSGPNSEAWDLKNNASVYVADGTYTYKIDAVDGLGNAGTQRTGTVTVDRTPPNVTIDQGAGQADPTSSSPMHFTAVFNEPVSGFGGGDVTIGGTAGGTKTVQVVDSGDHKTYDVQVSGMTSSGTVTATIPAGGAADAAGNGNANSTTPSGDNNVTWIALQANPDNAIVNANAIDYAIDVLANDTLPSGGSISSVQKTGTTPVAGTSTTTTDNGGSATICATCVNGGAGLYYTPATDYTGPDSFEYTITDGHGNYGTAKVSISVGATGTLDDQLIMEDADLHNINGSFDILFAKSPKPYDAYAMRLSNTNPGHLHLQASIWNYTNVNIDAAHTNRVTAILTVPDMPKNCGLLPYADVVAKTLAADCSNPGGVGKPAFALQGGTDGKDAVHAHPDDKTDELPVDVQYKVSGDCSDTSTGYSPTLPANGVAKCVKISGLAIKVGHKAKLDIKFDFRPTATDWPASANPQMNFRAGFNFKLNKLVTYGYATSSATTYASLDNVDAVGAGKKATAVGGFAFLGNWAPQADRGKPAENYTIRLFQTPPAATPGAPFGSCVTTPYAWSKVDSDGFFYIQNIGENTASSTGNTLPTGIQYYVQLCDPLNNALAGTLIDHKLGDKEFVEQDFNSAPPRPMTLSIPHHSGQPTNSDQIQITFSERLAETTMCSTWGMDNTKDQSLSAVTIRIENNTAASGNDKLIVQSVGSACGGTFNFGSIDLGSPNYVTAGNADFTNSKIQWNHNGTLTITLGGTPAVPTYAVTTMATAAYTPDLAMKDESGNAATGSASDTAGGGSSHF